MRWIALLAMLAASPCFAASTTLRWVNPTTFLDGTPLDVADIVSRRIQWTGNCPSFSFVAVDITAPGNGTEYVVENITPGLRCFRVFVTAKYSRCTVTVTDTCLRESPASNVWTKTFLRDDAPPPVVPIAARTPSAPTGLRGD
jgi:hypothetical protein